MKEQQAYFDFGYNKLGPLLWGYSHWLLDNFKRNNLHKVYFFSRDGQIMRKAFHIIRETKGIEDYYLEVSRRSLRVPILWKNPSLDNLITMLSPSGMISIKSIFDGVGLDVTAYKTKLMQYGFSEDTVFDREAILKSPKLLEMYKDIQPDIITKSKEEFSLLQKYIKQNNLHGKFAIVDIGWSGGMQRFLQETLNTLDISNEIWGFYTGVANYYKRNTNNTKLNLNGYLFDFSKNANDTDVRSCFVGLYELLFLETAGSVQNYKVDDTGRIIARRLPYEYSYNGAKMKEAQFIEIVQNAALQYIQDKESLGIKPGDKFCLFKPLLQAGSYPTKDTMNLFADFRFYDEGVFNYLAKPHGLFYYLLHPSNFKKDLYMSRWKTAFLRKVFKLPISYNGLYNILKSMST